MALVEFKLLPGIDKQQTQVGADKRWVNCDNVRFRYGLPEKVGGWSFSFNGYHCLALHDLNTLLLILMVTDTLPLELINFY